MVAAEKMTRAKVTAAAAAAAVVSVAAATAAAAALAHEQAALAAVLVSQQQKAERYLAGRKKWVLLQLAAQMLSQLMRPKKKPLLEP